MQCMSSLRRRASRPRFQGERIARMSKSGCPLGAVGGAAVLKGAHVWRASGRGGEGATRVSVRMGVR